MLVKACLNGARAATEHPAIPLAPSALARAGRAAVDAGADALHVHARALADGADTLAPTTVDAVMRALRAACPDVPIGLTTALWAAGEDPARRLDLVGAWAVLPDFVSVNVHEPGLGELVDLLVRRGIGIEAGVWTSDDAHAFLASGITDACMRVLVEVGGGDPNVEVARATEIGSLLTAAGSGLQQVHHGEARATWAVIGAAIDAGHGIRVGLEDTLVLPDGSVATDNAELVRAAVEIVRRRRGAQ